MASNIEPEYFPPLDQCLSGEQILFSWKSIFAILSELIEVNTEKESIQIVELTDDVEKIRGFLATNKIHRFLSKLETVELLRTPWTAFPPPGSTTKAAFDTKTAAINVAPATNGTYNLAEIKEDALHLSQFVNIDEVSALRVVVQEFQSRAKNELLMGMREEEAASLSNIMGPSSNLAMSAQILEFAKSDEEYKSFSSKEARRDRIVRIYLSEREYLVKTSEILYEVGIHQATTRDQQNGKPKKENLLTLLGSFIFDSYMGGKPEEFLLGLLNTLDSTIKELFDDKLRVEVESMSDVYAKSIMSEAVSYMEIIFQLLDSTVEISSPQLLLRWFEMFAQYSFLDSFSSPYDALQRIIPYMKCLVAVISVSMLRLPNSLGFLADAPNALPSGNAENPPSFLLDDDSIYAIQNIMHDCAEARLLTMSPAVFAWSLLLNTMQMAVREYEEEDGNESDSSGTEAGDPPVLASRRGRDMSPQVVRYKEILEQIFDSSVADNPISFMAEQAVRAIDEDTEDGGSGGSLLFDFLTTLGLLVSTYDRNGPSGILSSGMRATLLDLIAYGVSTLVYSPAIVDASLALITGGQQYWDLAKAPKLADAEDSFLMFIENPDLIASLFDVSAHRQPYERLPFLKFALALAASSTPDSDGNPAGGSLLDDRQTFTHTLSRNFRDFETKQEEDNTNLIALTRPLQIFTSRRASRPLFANVDDQFIIPADTDGRMVSETEPRVVVWFHPYSGYAYLGKLLETQLGNGDTIEAVGEPIDEESVADIIDLFATLLLSCTKLEHPQQAAQHILERASEGLSRTHDIINVIFDLFEHDMDNRSVNPGNHNFLGISISSVHFLHALMQFMPGRVWPFLARSRFLGTDGRGSKLSEIVTGTEIVTGHYRFLLSSIRLFDALVEDSVAHAVSRKAGGNTSLVRYSNLQHLGSGVPDQGLIRVINQFTSLFLDVFRSAHTWKYQVPEEQLHLFQLIGNVFSNIIRYVYGIEDSSEPKTISKLAGPLAEAARQIADYFLSTALENPHVQVILHAFVEGFAQIDFALEPSLLTLFHSRIAATFRLTITLLKLRSILELPSSELEKQLFSAVPLLVRLYADHESYKPLVLSLFKELVIGASNHVGEPTSLVGHLRPETLKSFLTILLDLDKPSESDNQVSSIWEFFSAVVSNRQRTLAIILLTGKTPRQALKNNDSSHLLEKPFLSVALDTLSTLDFDTERSRLDPAPPAIAMLEFIAKAQDFWPLQMGILQDHPKFIKSISTWVENLQPPSLNRADEKQLLEWCYRMRIASSIAEILAMYLFRCRESGNMSPVKDIIPKLRFFKDNAVTAPHYNSSLHGNLKRNFESRYGGLNPAVFQRTNLGKRTLGANYFYDIVMSHKMLKYNQAWEGRKDDGLFSEFIRANVNLSVVDAQIALLYGWKFLAIELRNSVSEEPDLQRLFAKITTECLISNGQEQPPESIFERLTQTRADFALMAMQTLLDTQSKKRLAGGVAPTVQNILERVWSSIQELRNNSEILSVADAQHYRSLLKLLYLALQAHAPPADNVAGASASAKPSVSKEIMIALEVTNHVIARGFRELAIAIHDQPGECLPEDIFLLTNILAACLRIPNIGFCHDQIINHMINNETARVAVTLFSWSDRLAIDGDPIYGELSIGFLLELSKMKAMAEQIAVDGALSQISSAGLANYLRQGNVSPFAEGVGPQRCYDIWVRGILPLLLNLLYSVGALIGAEVAIFLNQFTPLLQNSLRGLEPNDSNRAMSGLVLKPVISRVVSEINTLALINHILKDYRFSLAGTSDISEVQGLAALDGPSVLENAEFWLSSRQLLRERIMPMGPKELELSKQKALGKGMACENRLEERIVEELMGIRDILTPVNGDV